MIFQILYIMIASAVSPSESGKVCEYSEPVAKRIRHEHRLAN